MTNTLTNTLTLEAGQLYQVKHWDKAKGWVIAEYIRMIPAHSYKYNNLHLDTMTVGPEKVRNVPDSHAWKHVRPLGYCGSTFNIEDKKLEVRPVTQEAIATIARLREEIAQLDQAHKAKMRELREFCE